MNLETSPLPGYLTGMGRVAEVADQGITVLGWMVLVVITVAIVWLIRTRNDP
jgi:hypothetical protein